LPISPHNRCQPSSRIVHDSGMPASLVLRQARQLLNLGGNNAKAFSMAMKV
jgi:hypothetical protein